jgi:hypothetical protein
MLFSARTYSDPSRASDPYYLPSMLIQSEDGKTWSVECSMPGCLPESDPVTFSSPLSALEYCYEASSYADDDQPDFLLAARASYKGAFARLEGRIDHALKCERLFDAVYSEAERNGDTDGMDHVEMLAHEMARAALQAGRNPIR